jgi:hypothetical protein
LIKSGCFFVCTPAVFLIIQTKSLPAASKEWLAASLALSPFTNGQALPLIAEDQRKICSG